MQTLNSEDAVMYRNIYEKEGVVTIPFFTSENASAYRDYLIQQVPQCDWILSCGNQDIEWGLKNCQLIMSAWNREDLDDRYFFLPSQYKDNKVFNFTKNPTILNHIMKVLPNINSMVDPIAVLMTSGCYIGIHGGQEERVRFILHLTSDWKAEYGGTLTFQNTEIVPKFGYITIFKTTLLHNINEIIPNITIPHLSVTGFFN